MALFVCALLVCATGGTVTCLQVLIGLEASAMCFGRLIDLVGRWVGALRILCACAGIDTTLLDVGAQ